MDVCNRNASGAVPGKRRAGHGRAGTVGWRSLVSLACPVGDRAELRGPRFGHALVAALALVFAGVPASTAHADLDVSELKAADASTLAARTENDARLLERSTGQTAPGSSASTTVSSGRAMPRASAIASLRSTTSA